MRTVVYPHKVGPGEAETGASHAGTDPGDSYGEKLAKYVPAEVIAFFTPLAVFIGKDDPGLLWIVAAAGLLGTIIYLYRSARKAPEGKKPLVYFYILACLSYVVWAVATSPLFEIIGLTATQASVGLGITVFLVPGLDTLFSPKTAEQ
jgi:hypothetical protein